MSGGSLDYVYTRINDAADTIRSYAGIRTDCVILMAFADHLDRISDCLHDVEWDFSCDSHLDEEEYARLRALLAPGAILEEATKRAKLALEQLTAELEIHAKAEAAPLPQNQESNQSESNPKGGE